MIERIHLRFCKYILGLKSSTPNAMVYGEMGRYPLAITIKTRIISFWLKLLQGKKSKLIYKVYNLMYNMYIDNEFTWNWLDNVFKVLYSSGFGYI